MVLWLGAVIWVRYLVGFLQTQAGVFSVQERPSCQREISCLLLMSDIYTWCILLQKATRQRRSERIAFPCLLLVIACGKFNNIEASIRFCCNVDEQYCATLDSWSIKVSFSSFRSFKGIYLYFGSSKVMLQQVGYRLVLYGLGTVCV